MRQNDEAHAFYIIRSGKVEVSFETSTGERRVDMTLGVGQFFGEAALTGEPFHSHTVTAMEDCVIFALYRYDFTLFKDLDKLHAEFQDSFVKRYRPQRLEGYDLKENIDAEGNKTYRLSKHDGTSYFDLSPQGYFLWKMMDGDNSVNDLSMAFFFEFSRLDITYVVKIVRDLQTAGFLKTTSLDETKLGIKTDKKKTWRQKILGALLGNIEIHAIDSWISTFYKYFGWVLFTKPVTIFMAFLCSCGFLALFAVGFISTKDEVGFKSIFLPPVSNFFTQGPLPFWWLWILGFILLSLFIHELGHALAVKHYRRRLFSGGFSYFLPLYVAPYVNTSDMYNEPRKWARIAVDVAGPAANMLVCAFCSFGALLIELFNKNNYDAERALFQFATISFLLAFYNILPVMQSDGYYALSNYFGISNLRKKALAFGRNLFSNRKANQNLKRRERVPYTIYLLFIPLYIIITGLQLAFWLSQVLVGTFKDLLRDNFGMPLNEATGMATLISWLLAITVTLVLAILTVKDIIQTSRDSEKTEI